MNSYEPEKPLLREQLRETVYLVCFYPSLPPRHLGVTYMALPSSSLSSQQPYEVGLFIDLIKCGPHCSLNKRGSGGLQVKYNVQY